jgi:hypothetical protein
MKAPLAPWIAMFIAAALVSCASQKSATLEKPETPEKSDAPVLIGRIASIPADKRFVLIQSYANQKVRSGTILTTRGTQGRTANLRATGESLGQFAAADLQSGTLEVGDAVYSRHTPKPIKPPAEAIMKPELPDSQELHAP